jgi:hypothetical protein
MKNKTFSLLFALMLGFATVNAQQSSDEKYEYAIVEYKGKIVSISTSDGVFEERNVQASTMIPSNSRKDFLNIIKEMNDNGWMVINAEYEAQVGRFLYHLQKKRTN